MAVAVRLATLAETARLEKARSRREVKIVWQIPHEAVILKREGGHVVACCNCNRWSGPFPELPVAAAVCRTHRRNGCWEYAGDPLPSRPDEEMPGEVEVA